MIAASREVGYIWEPFNPQHSRGIFNAPVDRYYTWVSDHNSFLYESALRDTLSFKFDTLAEAKSITSARELAKMPLGYSRSLLYKREGRRPLLKDPLALFAAEWIVSTFDAQPVVLVRHPAAFVNSLLKAGWRHPFADFLEQPKLMEEHLEPFRSEIECLARTRVDLLDEATLLWRVIHHMIRKYRDAHPNWLFVRHEELSLEPIRQFGRLFEYLGLDYAPNVKGTIKNYTREGNPIERPGEPWPMAARLNSRRNAYRWAERLSEGQIDRIRERSQDVWPAFYSDADWNAGRAPEMAPASGAQLQADAR
jgi:hypothetical protein